jgi:phosphoenolpyruvate carboxykinase (GTP)
MAATTQKLLLKYDSAEPHHRLRMTSFMATSDIVGEVDDVTVPNVGVVHVPVVKGEFTKLPAKVQEFIATYVDILKPKGIYICDGSEEEREEITDKLVDRGLLIPLDRMENCYACRTDPGDVARVESKTFMVTPEKYTTVPHVKEGFKGMLGQWMSNDDMDKEMESRIPGAMNGRVMYVIPFSMGPIGGPMSKIGIQLTDFNYVILSMSIMTRVSPKVWDALGDGEFVKCIHTIGAPRPVKKKDHKPLAG